MDKRLEHVIDKLHFLREEIDLILEEYDFNEKTLDVRWNCFLADLDMLQDPLLFGLMTKAAPENIGSGVVNLVFPKDHKFFEEWLERSQDQWIGLFHNQFGNTVMPSFEFKDK